MSAYIQRLNAAVAATQAQHDEQQRADALADARATRERLLPLKDRLARLLATIPVEVLREGLSLASLQGGLRGRWRGNCHPGELGAALRKLGFERRRQWNGEPPFQALWYPPPGPPGR